MVHINGASLDILSAVATTAPIAPTVQIFSPSSAVIVPPATSSSSLTTTTTTAAAETCFDTPNWTDAYGQNCAYYAYNGGYRCALWGRSGAGYSSGVAVDNCCACGGGGGGGDGHYSNGDDSSSGSVTTTTTTAAADDDDEGGDNNNAVMVVGTCGMGGGKRGNGICANGKCCSEFGWCGSTPAHCNYTIRPTTNVPTLAPITLVPTTTSPTTTLDVIANWESMTYSIDINWDILTIGHGKFCGPAIVGGYDIALAMCSPYTECGKTIITDKYGINGNDCPEGLMCFGDIVCMPPTPTTTTTTGSSSPNIMPAITTLVPTIIETTVATSSSYCGSTYADAKQACTPSTMCITDDDCIKFGTTNNNADDGDSWGGRSCFTNITCTIGWQNDEDVIIITTTPTTASPPSASSSSSSSSSSASTPTAGTNEISDILQEGIAATSLLVGISDIASSPTKAGTNEITNNMKKTNTIVEKSTPSITVTTTSPTTTITTASIVDDYIIIESSPVLEVDTDDDVVVIDIANFQENKIGLTSGEVEGGGESEGKNDDNNDEYHEVAVGRPMERFSSGKSNSQEFVPKWPADYSGVLTLNRRHWSSVGIMLLAVVLCRW